MQIFKFYLNNGEIFEGTFQDLYNQGYKDADIRYQDPEFSDEEVYKEYHWRFYNSFRQTA